MGFFGIPIAPAHENNHLPINKEFVSNFLKVRRGNFRDLRNHSFILLSSYMLSIYFVKLNKPFRLTRRKISYENSVSLEEKQPKMLPRVKGVKPREC